MVSGPWLLGSADSILARQAIYAGEQETRNSGRIRTTAVSGQSIPPNAGLIQIPRGCAHRTAPDSAFNQPLSYQRRNREQQQGVKATSHPLDAALPNS